MELWITCRSNDLFWVLEGTLLAGGTKIAELIDTFYYVVLHKTPLSHYELMNWYIWKCACRIRLSRFNYCIVEFGSLLEYYYWMALETNILDFVYVFCLIWNFRTALFTFVNLREYPSKTLNFFLLIFIYLWFFVFLLSSFSFSYFFIFYFFMF